jgi:hypothetical protein
MSSVSSDTHILVYKTILTKVDDTYSGILYFALNNITSLDRPVINIPAYSSTFKIINDYLHILDRLKDQLDIDNSKKYIYSLIVKYIIAYLHTITDITDLSNILQDRFIFLQTFFDTNLKFQHNLYIQEELNIITEIFNRNNYILKPSIEEQSIKLTYITKNHGLFKNIINLLILYYKYLDCETNLPLLITKHTKSIINLSLPDIQKLSKPQQVGGLSASNREELSKSINNLIHTCDKDIQTNINTYIKQYRINDLIIITNEQINIIIDEHTNNLKTVNAFTENNYKILNFNNIEKAFIYNPEYIKMKNDLNNTPNIKELISTPTSYAKTSLHFKYIEMFKRFKDIRNTNIKNNTYIDNYLIDNATHISNILLTKKKAANKAVANKAVANKAANKAVANKAVANKAVANKAVANKAANDPPVESEEVSVENAESIDSPVENAENKEDQKITEEQILQDIKYLNVGYILEDINVMLSNNLRVSRANTKISMTKLISIINLYPFNDSVLSLIKDYKSIPMSKWYGISVKVSINKGFTGDTKFGYDIAYANILTTLHKMKQEVDNKIEPDLLVLSPNITQERYRCKLIMQIIKNNLTKYSWSSAKLYYPNSGAVRRDDYKEDILKIRVYVGNLDNVYENYLTNTIKKIHEFQEGYISNNS